MRSPFSSYEESIIGGFVHSCAEEAELTIRLSWTSSDSRASGSFASMSTESTRAEESKGLDTTNNRPRIISATFPAILGSMEQISA